VAERSTPSRPEAVEPLLHVVLVAPEIPPNTGTIARLCAATGSRLHLVRPLGFSLDDRYLKRAGLDYWPYVDVVVYDDWPEFGARHRGARAHFFSARASRPYTAAAYRPGDFLVFGSETKGLPPEMLARHSDDTWVIPIFSPNVRSLNLSNAASVVVYEALRQLGRLE
jgi:tRNA (cytidine/uridine-2'-O-)-methyltransferase